MKRTCYFSAGALAVGIFLLYQTGSIKNLWKEPMGTRVYPTAAVLLLILSALWNLVKNVRRYKAAGKAEQEKTEREKLGQGSCAPVWLVALLSLMYVMGLQWIGFYTATFVFVLLLTASIAYYTDRQTWKKKFLHLGVPLVFCMMILLKLAVGAMHIYLPSNGLLW